MSLFTDSPLHIEPIGKRNYRLLSPIIWQLIYGSDYMRCIIPAGYETDFDSTPFWARPLLPTRWRARKSMALHDWGYGEGWAYRKVNEHYFVIERGTRAEWDMVWYQAMLAEGMNKWVALTMYKTIRAVGWVRWNQCEAQRQASFDAKLIKQSETNEICLKINQ